MSIIATGADIDVNDIGFGHPLNMRTGYDLPRILKLAQRLRQGYAEESGPVIVCRVKPFQSEPRINMLGKDMSKGLELQLDDDTKVTIRDEHLPKGEANRTLAVVNGQGRMLAAMIMAALGYSVTIPFREVTEAEARGLSAKIDADENARLKHSRHELLAHVVRMLDNDATLSQAQIGRLIGFTPAERTKLQWVDAAARYCQRTNDHDYQRIDSLAVDAATLKAATGRIADKSTVAKSNNITVKTLQALGLLEFATLVENSDTVALTAWAKRTLQALHVLDAAERSDKKDVRALLK